MTERSTKDDEQTSCDTGRCQDPPPNPAVSTHPSVIPPDVEGDVYDNESDSVQDEHDNATDMALKSKESHELCHHVHHSDRCDEPVHVELV